MNDDFDNALWAMVKDSPCLQKAIMSGLDTEHQGYSIPVGNILESVFEMDDDITRNNYLTLIDIAGSMKVKDLDNLLKELRAMLIASELEGNELTIEEKTLRDIDILSFTLWALVKRLQHSLRIGSKNP